MPQVRTCPRCSTSGLYHRWWKHTPAGVLCPRCRLAEDLAEVLDDGTGQIASALRPLYEALCAQASAGAALFWIHQKANPGVRQLLSSMARGTLPVAHATLDAHPSVKTAVHMRDLFMQLGLLEPRDRHLVIFENWLTRRLQTITESEDARLVHRFAAWRSLRGLREAAQRQPVTEGMARYHRQQITAAITFLTWLRPHGRTLATCRQADLDAWLADGPTTRHKAVPFLRWASSSGHLPGRLTLSAPRTGTHPTLGQDERLRLLGDVLAQTGRALHLRIAATLLLLYAQPISRIAQMSLAQMHMHGDEVSVDLGGRQPIPVPEPFAQLFRDYLAAPRLFATTGNAGSPWLFPGMHAGRHLSPTQIRNRLRTQGIHLRGARNAALRELVRQLPPALAAQALGYSSGVTERHAREAGRNWASYASYRRQAAPNSRHLDT